MFRIRLFTTKSASALLLLGVQVALSPTVRAFQDPHAQGGQPQAEAASKPAQEFNGDPYLLDTDPVSGQPLGPLATQIVIDHEGRELRFSSQANADAFKADPGKYLPAIDAKMIAQQKPFYPLDACVISDEKLGGEMGEPIDFIYKNRLVRFCCKKCKPEFLKDPAKTIATLDKAVIAKQSATYPATACVVSGEKLGGDMGPPVDVVVGNRLVRFCCKDCQKEFRKDPLKYLGNLHGEPKHAGEGHEDGHDHEHPKAGGDH